MQKAHKVKLTFQLKRGTSARWQEINPILADGEPGFELDTRRLKIGNGKDAWNDLPYSTSSDDTFVTPEELQEALEHFKISEDDVAVITEKTINNLIAAADDNDDNILANMSNLVDFVEKNGESIANLKKAIQDIYDNWDSIEVDDHLDPNSTNPVQNKAVKTALDNLNMGLSTVQLTAAGARDLANTALDKANLAGSHVGGVDARVRVLETQVGEINTQVTEAKQDIENISNVVEDTQQQVHEFEAQVNDIDTSLSEQVKPNLVPAVTSADNNKLLQVIDGKWNATNVELGISFTDDGEGNVKIKGSTGGSTANAVLYIPQTLTEEQKAQARENIGAGAGSSDVSIPDASTAPFDSCALVAKGGKWEISTEPVTTVARLQEVSTEAKVAKNTADQAKTKVDDTVNRVATLETQIGDFDERVIDLENSTESVILYTPQVLTEEQKVQARDNIGVDTDVEYKSGINLYNGEWELGKYNLATGEKQSSTNHARNIKPILLDATKRYNIAIKVGYSTTLYLLKYDADMNFLGKVQQSISSKVRHVHFENTAYINFYLQDWITKYPNEKPQVMVYESEIDAPPTEWQEYGASEQYYKNNLLVRGEQIVGGVPSADITLAIDKARFDERFNYVAYSTIGSIGKDQNSREFFEWAAKKEFTAIKGDMRITSDNKLVMLHDTGFVADENGKITQSNDTTAEGYTSIRDLTEAECLALQFARYGGYICSFDEYVRICKKYGKIAYITIRNEYTSEIVPEMMRILRKYGMVKQSIVSGYPSNTPLTAVREADPTIMLAWVLGKNADITTGNIDYAVSMGNMLICGFNFTSASDDVATKLAGSLGAIEYAHEKDIRVYECQIHSMEIADKLMEYGITGAQIMFNPSFE